MMIFLSIAKQSSPSQRCRLLSLRSSCDSRLNVFSVFPSDEMAGNSKNIDSENTNLAELKGAQDCSVLSSTRIFVLQTKKLGGNSGASFKQH